MLVASAGILLAALNPLARAETKHKIAHRTVSRKETAAHPSTRASAKSRSTHRRAPVRTTSYRYTIRHIHPEADRISEIQAALQKAGYLNQDPNGQWDDATKAAMTRYQTDNGFNPTGLPEAKPLLKLGLGPHPLPASVGLDSPAIPTENTSPNPASQADQASKPAKPNGSGFPQR